jgi:hypothetical protein
MKRIVLAICLAGCGGEVAEGVHKGQLAITPPAGAQVVERSESPLVLPEDSPYVALTAADRSALRVLGNVEQPREFYARANVCGAVPALPAEYEVMTVPSGDCSTVLVRKLRQY